MLNIYSTHKIDADDVITDVDILFDGLVFEGELFDEKIYRMIMQEIDGVTDKNEMIITTDFGRTSLNNLSTGCKTVILAVYFSGIQKYVKLDECGENALRLLNKLGEKYELNTVTKYALHFTGIVNINFNNTHFTNGRNLYREMMIEDGIN